MKKNWIGFVLLGVFLFWIAPELFSNCLGANSTPSQVVVEHRFLGFSAGQSVYSRDAIRAIGIRYHKAYFDLKMRGIYRIGLQLRDGKFIILKQLNTTLQYELSLAYAPDLKIKHKQSLDEARKIAAQLGLVIEDETLEM